MFEILASRYILPGFLIRMQKKCICYGIGFILITNKDADAGGSDYSVED